MEQIIAIKINDKKKGLAAFITWGRIFNETSPTSLLEEVAKHLSKFGIKNIQAIDICESLQEVAAFPYFYEALLEFSRTKIPRDEKEYKIWKRKIQIEISKGKEIYFLGFINK